MKFHADFTQFYAKCGLLPNQIDENQLSITCRRKDFSRATMGLFRYSPLPPPQRIISPPVEAVAAATSVFTEYVFYESVDNAHNS